MLIRHHSQAIQQQLQQQQAKLYNHVDSSVTLHNGTFHLQNADANNNKKLILPTIPDFTSTLTATPPKLGHGLNTINANDIANNGLESLLTKPLNTPKLYNKSPSETPLLDENPTHILPQLHLQTADLDDPLHKEAMCDEPEQRRQKLEDKTVQDESTNMGDIIMKAAKLIADALDANTKAVKQSEKAITKIVEELARIERNINCIKRTVTTKQSNNSEENEENNNIPNS